MTLCDEAKAATKRDIVSSSANGSGLMFILAINPRL